jgi:acyl-CoA thioesterase-2
MSASAEDQSLLALDGLLRALELEPIGTDRFRAVNEEPARFPRVFGGLLVAQALLGAAATVDGTAPLSIHATFAESGHVDRPLDVAVTRVRDGRSLTVRNVALSQGERTVLVATVAFHANPAEPVRTPPPPRVAPPDELPTVLDWAARADERYAASARIWLDHPPPVDVRIGEPQTFLGGVQATTPRSHWMRVPRMVDGDDLLHLALLAYASDYFLLDMAIRSHPDPNGWRAVQGITVDHAVWFHRPVRFDRWHLHTQRTIALTGHRGVVEGLLHDDEGNLVATVAQDTLLVPARPRPPVKASGTRPG